MEANQMSFQTLEIVKENKYAWLKMNRVQAHNALSTQMALDLKAALDMLARDPEVWAVALASNAEKSFCVGADLKERQGMSKHDMFIQREIFVEAFIALLNFPKPLVASVNGFALGGGTEMALCCDFIIAGEKAVFGLPEVGLGIIPGGGGTQNLPRAIGKPLAKELIFTGRKISAEKAHEYGFVNVVVSQDGLQDSVREILEEMIKNGPLALQQAKKAVNYGMNVDLMTGMRIEAESYYICLHSEDRDEGLVAFNEKRKPNYKGR